MKNETFETRRSIAERSRPRVEDLACSCSKSESEDARGTFSSQSSWRFPRVNFCWPTRSVSSQSRRIINHVNCRRWLVSKRGRSCDKPRSSRQRRRSIRAIASIARQARKRNATQDSLASLSRMNWRRRRRRTFKSHNRAIRSGGLLESLREWVSHAHRATRNIHLEWPRLICIAPTNDDDDDGTRFT